MAAAEMRREPQSMWKVEKQSTHFSAGEPKPPRCQISVCGAIFSAICMSVVLSWLVLFVPLTVVTRQSYRGLEQSLKGLVDPQEQLIHRLVRDKVDSSYASLMVSIGGIVRQFITEPADQTVSLVSTVMQAKSRLEVLEWNHSGSTAHQRDLLGLEACFELMRMKQTSNQVFLNFKDPKNLTLTRHVDELFVLWDNGDLVGVSAVWGEGNDGNAAEGFYVDTLNQSREENKGKAGAWALDPKTCRSVGLPTKVPYTMTIPQYEVQREHAARAMLSQARTAQSMWSRLFIMELNQGNVAVGLAFTKPIAHCGEYDCFNGVIAATVSTPYVSWICTEALSLIKQSSDDSIALLDENHSTIFVVNQKSRFPDQEGILIGSSNNSNPDASLRTNLTHARDAAQGSLVRAATFALLERFNSFQDPALSGRQSSRSLVFNSSAAMENPPRFVECDDVTLNNMQPECLQVETSSVKLDPETFWLVVMVLPTGLFGKEAKEIMEEAQEKVMNQTKEWHEQKDAQEASMAFLLTCMTAASLAMAGVVSFLVAKPLWHLSSLSALMHRLGDLDFAPESDELKDLRAGARSHIKEVCKLQSTFCRLSQGVETFARFVPEGLVRDIVSGNLRATRPHVQNRWVTIMFTDIRDFTNIAEQLSQTDLLSVLTCYLKAMGQVAEDYEGEVTEILGDGMLVFWNTPKDVEDHAVKACRAALAMQDALRAVNQELRQQNFPGLSIRIGLHTGRVLSGNIGSDKKMKFGCLGDPVNLASRIEGLCKYYGAGVCLSGATFEELPADSGLLCRKLALVQVKGKRQPTWVYQLLGREPKEGYDASDLQAGFVVPVPSSLGRQISEPVSRSLSSLTSGAGGRTCKSFSIDTEAAARDHREHAKVYEEALQAYHEARFAEACDLAARVLERWPDDLAAARLQEDAKPYAPGGSTPLVDEELAAWDGVVAIREK